MPASFDCCMPPRRRFNQNIPPGSCCCSSAIAGIAIGANFKIYLLCQFCSNRARFFLQYTGDTDAKNDGPEFWNSNSVTFENFFKFSKRHRVVPPWPIWTTMVAAKLDQRRVLVTKFHQNRSTLKGRSAGQRQRDRQTDRQTRLKIMALQVCNRTNRHRLQTFVPRFWLHTGHGSGFSPESKLSRAYTQHIWQPWRTLCYHDIEEHNR